MRKVRVDPDGVAPVSALSDASFARVRDLIEERCGLDFGDSRRASLEAALHARMQQLGIAAHAVYFDRLSAQPGDDEFRSLINLVTITETCFFRDPAQFRMLRMHIIPALLAERAAAGRRTLRICSAGCSSGEEPYSIALLLREMGLHVTHAGWTIEIVGIDVNTVMLDAARRGLYSPKAVRNVQGERLQQHFTPVGRGFQLDRAIMQAVRFEHGSLLQDPPFAAGAFDLILCKNVAIYFRLELTRRLVDRLHAALDAGGYLLLGHSESLWQIEQGLQLVEHEGVFGYRKPAAARAAAFTWMAPVQRATREATAAFDEPASHYERVLRIFRDGDWTAAEAGVQAIVASSPAFVPARLLLAGLHAHLGRHDDARKEAEGILRINDLEPKAHLLLGMIAARAGRTAEAVQALRRALCMDDSLALAYFWLGNLYRDGGEYERALEEHGQAVARYERRQLDFTEEFAADLSPSQIINVCRQSVRRLGRAQ